MTAPSLQGMEWTSWRHFARSIFFHSSRMTTFRDWMLDGEWCSTCLFRIPHRCSIGFRSGDILGHWITFTLFFFRNPTVALDQIKSLLLSHHHSTSALVSEILMSVLQTVQKNKTQQFTYGQYIFTDCTEDNVQNTHTYTQYTQCTIKTYLIINYTLYTVWAHLHYVHYLYIM